VINAVVKYDAFLDDFAKEFQASEWVSTLLFDGCESLCGAVLYRMKCTWCRRRGGCRARAKCGQIARAGSCMALPPRAFQRRLWTDRGALLSRGRERFRKTAGYHRARGKESEQRPKRFGAAAEGKKERSTPRRHQDLRHRV